MASLSCKEKAMLVTTSHIEETLGSSGQRYFDLHGLQDDDLADRFREACKKLEGLMYAALGSVPASYADGKQWWESNYPRCLWPEQAFIYDFGGPNPPTGQFGQWYYMPGCNGRIGSLTKTGYVPIGSTGYFDWSRSDVLPRQYRRTNHDPSFFPPDAVERYCPAGEYDDPLPNQPVTITWHVPASVRSRVHTVTLYYRAASGLASVSMSSGDGGQSYTGIIPGQDNETQVLFYLQVVTNDPTPLTIHEPHGQAANNAPSLSDILGDPAGSPPGWGHSLQQKGTCYYYRVFEHRHQYAAGFPELIWEEYTGAKAAGLKRCTGTWRFEPWTTIKPALINLCRFMLDYLGSKFHHHPGRRGSHGSCCMFLPIIWRWTGSARPWQYKTGGKGGADELRPLHNNPSELNDGSTDSRRTWRGAPGLFQEQPDNMASAYEAFEYADDESWRSWPLRASYLYKDSGPWAPGAFKLHGKDRGLREGDVVDHVHLMEIIAAVDYLIDNGLWYHEVVPTCMRTPTGCFPWSGQHGREYHYTDPEDPNSPNRDQVRCFDTCGRGTCVEGTEPIIPWNAPSSVENCRHHLGEGVTGGVCTKVISWSTQYYSGCEGAAPDGPFIQHGALCKSITGWASTLGCQYEAQCADTGCVDDEGHPVFNRHSWQRYGRSVGWSAFLCGPPRWADAIGSETYVSGNPMWTIIDTNHGNGTAKVRGGSRTSPNWADHRGPQTPKPMGNSSSQALACHENVDGSTHTTPVTFDAVTAVETGGRCAVWGAPSFTNSSEGCSHFSEPDAVVPPLPGLGLFDVQSDGTRPPLCQYFSEEADPEAGVYGWTDALCFYLEAGSEACQPGAVWKNVDLNLNANGIPQLHDYNLNIRMLQDGGGEYGPPRYPDTVYNNCGSQCVDTYGRVFCPFDTWI